MTVDGTRHGIFGKVSPNDEYTACVKPQIGFLANLTTVPLTIRTIGPTMTAEVGHGTTRPIPSIARGPLPLEEN